MGSFTVACVWDPVPRPGIEPGPPALGAWSLSHWTTGGVPVIVYQSISPLIFALPGFQLRAFYAAGGWVSVCGGRSRGRPRHQALLLLGFTMILFASPEQKAPQPGLVPPHSWRLKRSPRRGGEQGASPSSRPALLLPPEHPGMCPPEAPIFP